MNGSHGLTYKCKLPGGGAGEKPYTRPLSLEIAEMCTCVIFEAKSVRSRLVLEKVASHEAWCKVGIGSLCRAATIPRDVVCGRRHQKGSSYLPKYLDLSSGYGARICVSHCNLRCGNVSRHNKYERLCISRLLFHIMRTGALCNIHK